MVILDCCRNDPFSGKRAWMRSRSRSGGLAEVADRDLPESTLIMYSSGPGQTAADGANGNSPFTEVFSKVIAKPGVSCLEAFFQVSDHVKEQTGGRQQPWVKFDGAADAFRRYTFRGDPPSVRPGTEAGMVSISDQDLANMKEEIERMKEEIEQARLDGLQPVAQVSSPTQEQLAPRKTAEQSLEEFLISWFQNQASNSATLWASDFADFPKYCYWEGRGGTPRSFIIEDRQKLITRYARREYQQLGNATVEWFDNFTRAILVVSLHYEYSGQKRARGNTFMTMSLRWIDGQWKIVGFDETVRRNAYASSANQGHTPQPSAGGGAINDQILGTFISGWKRNQASNNASDWVSDFNSSVSYCYKNNGKANHSYLRNDRAKLIKKRPNRSYQVTDANYQRRPDGNVEAVVTYRYDYGGSIKGRCTVTMTLRRAGHRLLITSYDEKVIKN